LGGEWDLTHAFQAFRKPELAKIAPVRQLIPAKMADDPHVSIGSAPNARKTNGHSGSGTTFAF